MVHTSVCWYDVGVCHVAVSVCVSVRCDAEREIESLKQQLAEKEAVIDNMQQTQHWYTHTHNHTRTHTHTHSRTLSLGVCVCRSAAKVRELDMVRFESQLKDALILDKDRQIERFVCVGEWEAPHGHTPPVCVAANMTRLEKSFAHLNSDPAE